MQEYASAALKASLLAPKERQRRRRSLTVCIAAKSHDGAVFCATDRMITVGDIEMESPVSKIYPITSAIAILPSDDDSALHEEIIMAVQHSVHNRITITDPGRWLLVSDVVAEYINAFTGARQARAERAILAPFSLTHDTFLTQQSFMETGLVGRIGEDLVRFALPNMSVIVAGIDENGAHLYEVHNGDSGCFDSIGYATIGGGARHARAHLMMAGQSGFSSSPETLWNTYFAKKRAEVAPGVGRRFTDMLLIGPELGRFTWVKSEIMSQVHKLYEQTIRHEQEARKNASEEMNAYVERLVQETHAAKQEKLPEPAPKESPEDLAKFGREIG